MIQIDKDGVTLFYIDANGNRVAHNVMDGELYDDMLTIRGDQLQAASDNTQAVSNYNTELANAQISVSAGRTATAPPKPLQKVVADADGTITYVPFVPPLADLVIPITDPSTVTGLVNPTVLAPVDKQAIMYNMILAMFKKAFPDA